MNEVGTVAWYTVLPVGLDPEGRERLRGALAPMAAVVTAGADDWSEALELASAGHYDSLVVAYPLGDAPTAGFLAGLRKPSCPCRNSAVVLLTEERYRTEAATYLGRGANRVVTWEEAGLALPSVLEGILNAAPRVPLETSVRIKPVGDGASGPVPGRTVNLSTSGMLLRVRKGFEPGTLVVFEMHLPGSAVPLRGRGRVVRRTSVRREPFPGVGVTFGGLEDGGPARLRAFLGDASA